MNTIFIEAVENNNYSRVRYALSDELLLDPRGNSFHEMLTFAESKMDSLFEKDNGKRSEKDSSQWDKDFLFSVKNELDKNFSREKLLYYEQVAKQVLKNKAHQLDEGEKEQTEPHDGNCEQQSENKSVSHKEKVYLGVTIGGALLTTVGLCVSKDTFSTIFKIMFKETFSTTSIDTVSIISKVAITILGIAGIAIGGYQLYNEYKKNNI